MQELIQDPSGRIIIPILIHGDLIIILHTVLRTMVEDTIVGTTDLVTCIVIDSWVDILMDLITKFIQLYQGYVTLESCLYPHNYPKIGIR